MNQQERTEQSVKILAASALWYAWGQIDPPCTTPDLTTEHGQEFGRLYEQLSRDHAFLDASRPSVLDAWKHFVAIKAERGAGAPVTAADIKNY